jgi:hypothetical protein
MHFKAGHVSSGPLMSMKRRHTNPVRSTEVGHETPLRLDVAAALAYPDGSMTASGLRREAKRGRLVIERTAGKDYTTLAAIERMRELCRVEPTARVSGLKKPNETPMETLPIMPAGASRTAAANTALAAARTTVAALKKPSPPISPRSMSPAPRAASVHRLPSRWPT